jgi:hypothetical protein
MSAGVGTGDIEKGCSGPGWLRISAIYSRKVGGVGREMRYMDEMRDIYDTDSCMAEIQVCD